MHWKNLTFDGSCKMSDIVKGVLPFVSFVLGAVSKKRGCHRIWSSPAKCQREFWQLSALESRWPQRVNKLSKNITGLIYWNVTFDSLTPQVPTVIKSLSMMHTKQKILHSRNIFTNIYRLSEVLTARNETWRHHV